MTIEYEGIKTMALLVGVAAIAVVIAIMLDLASGLRKATLMGNARTSYAYERTTTKLIQALLNKVDFEERAYLDIVIENSLLCGNLTIIRTCVLPSQFVEYMNAPVSIFLIDMGINHRHSKRRVPQDVGQSR